MNRETKRRKVIERSLTDSNYAKSLLQKSGILTDQGEVSNIYRPTEIHAAMCNRQYWKVEFHNQSQMNKIDRFADKYFFLSNFYYTPVTYDGMRFRSSEAAYQAQKCKHLQDKEMFRNMGSAEAKKFGKGVVLRDDWADVKVSIMTDIVRCKFKQNHELAKMLVDTGDTYLEEGNWWGDVFWGVCNGAGENWLGKILMQVRDEIDASELELPKKLQ